MSQKNKQEMLVPNKQDIHSLILQDAVPNQKSFCSNDLLIGARLRAFRQQKGISIRSLAAKCGIGVNTLSLIENNRTSPNVNTLKTLADGLEIPIVSFFDEEKTERSIIYQKNGQRLKTQFSNGSLEDLGQGLPALGAEPILVTLEKTKEEVPVISHLGREFIYCIEGAVTCEIANELYPLFPGDSLLFYATAPHRWVNSQSRPSRLLVLFCAMEAHEQPTEMHLNS